MKFFLIFKKIKKIDKFNEKKRNTLSSEYPWRIPIKSSRCKAKNVVKSRAFAPAVLLSPEKKDISPK